MQAAEYGEVRCVRLLLERGADGLPKNKWNDTAMSIAKKGASAPTPLSEFTLGTGPRIIQDRAPPLEDELRMIGERQAEWEAKHGKPFSLAVSAS